MLVLGHCYGMSEFWLRWYDLRWYDEQVKLNLIYHRTHNYSLSVP